MAARGPRRPLVAFALVLVVAACSGGSSKASKPSTSATAASTAGTAASTSTPSSAPATTGDLAGVRVKLTAIAPLDQATAMTVRAGDDTLYVAEQGGRVRAVRDGRLVEQPVIDLSGRVQSGGERGLLGLAFSPDGSKLYVDYTNLDGDTRVDEYAMHERRADPASRRELLAIRQPQENHNGGQLVFGPDGMLYVGTGDGGGAGDEGPGHAPSGNGQSLDTLLGKILRIDPRPSGGRQYGIPPDNPFANGGGRPEIWAYGLRNPWRFSFDRATHDLWIADVGQNSWEEVDFSPATPAGAGRGANYGWNRLEATHRFRGSPPARAVAPIFEYSHDGGRCSISGGFVYRGRRIPDLLGSYVFTDYCVGTVRALRESNAKLAGTRALGVEAREVSGFGEDGAGELYVLSQSDGLLRVDPA